MNLAERHHLIVAMVTESNRVSVATLAEATGASEMTIRRDLETLESQGVVRRVHGGAISTLLGGVEPPYAIRAALGAEVKEQLATIVVGLLRDGETVALDTGTTVVAIARAMGNRNLTVTPLSLRATFPLADCPGIRLLMPGGQVRPGELSFHGQSAVRTFEEHCYDTFVLSCCGVDLDAGVTAYDLDDVHVKRAAVQAARRIILVSTADKVGRVALGRVCPLSQVQTMVTDAPSDAPVIQELRANGVAVLRPPA